MKETVQEYYSNKILKSTEYGGEHKTNNRAISCSQVGSDPQEALMRYKYGVIKDNDIGQNTIGSLIHSALSVIDFGENCYKEKSFEIDFLDTGWQLTGSIDRIDFDKKIIIDTKVTKSYTIKMLKKEPLHSYKLQINAYRYIIKKLYDVDMDMYLEIFDKQGGYDARNNVDVPSLVYLKINKIDDSIIEEKILNLIEFIKIGEEKQCDDLFWRKVKGKSLPIKCMKYCSYKNKCSKYGVNPTSEVSMW